MTRVELAATNIFVIDFDVPDLSVGARKDVGGMWNRSLNLCSRLMIICDYLGPNQKPKTFPSVIDRKTRPCQAKVGTGVPRLPREHGQLHERPGAPPFHFLSLLIVFQ